jgi:hypothetical protein
VICPLGVLVLLSLAPDTRAASTMSGPAEAKTTAEIVSCAEKDDLRGGLRREPSVSSAEYRSRHQKAFVAWYNPYSGEAACHVYVYVHNDKKGVWVQKVARVFRGTPRVSVEFGDAITIRDVKGKVIHRYPAK